MDADFTTPLLGEACKALKSGETSFVPELCTGLLVVIGLGGLAARRRVALTQSRYT